MYYGMRPGVPLVGEGYDGDLSMQISMVMEALTCPGKVLLTMVLGRMGTSGDSRVGCCARGREIVWDGHQLCIYDHNHSGDERLYEGSSCGKISGNSHEQGGPGRDGGHNVVPRQRHRRINPISTIRGRELGEWFQEDVEMVLPHLKHQGAERPYLHSSRA